MVVVWDLPEPVVMDLVDGRLEVPRASLSAAVFGSRMSSENGTIPTLTGKLFRPFISTMLMRSVAESLRSCSFCPAIDPVTSSITEISRLWT